MSIPSYRLQYFHRIPIGKQLRFNLNGTTLTKTSKGYAYDATFKVYERIHPQKFVFEITDSGLDELDDHTTTFTQMQLAEVIERILDRAIRTYGKDRIDVERLRKGIYCAHALKPIRLIDLLHTCFLDFPSEILYGIYRHYDPKTDTMQGGWTAKHSLPYYG